MPSTNNDIEAALEYHQATNHSVESLRSTNYRLDFSNQPRTHKLYEDELETILLPRGGLPSKMSALEAISSAAVPGEDSVPDLAALATLLELSGGITKWLTVPGGKMAFRAASCTGAMYHIEQYLVTGDLSGLSAGVYHFSVHDNSLRRLRSGDYRDVLLQATGNEPGMINAPVSIVYTTTCWRNSWKYRERAYRHAFWDSGTILSNMLALAGSRGIPAKVVTGFVDEQLNRLVGVDGEREMSVAMVPLGYSSAMRSQSSVPPDELKLPIVPYSRGEISYPAIRKVHNAGVLNEPEDVALWRVGASALTSPTPSGQVVPLALGDSGSWSPTPLEEVIRRRGSTRRFDYVPIDYAKLSILLSASTGPIRVDYCPPGSAPLNDVYLIVNAVEGLPSGTYVYHREGRSLELLRAGFFRQEAGLLALDQSLGADAAVNIYFLAELGPILDRLGNRGYRAAQLDASITAGRMYLAAYAQGLGATGLTFFDEEVTQFFSPHAAGKSVMFLMALGRSARGVSGG